MVRQSRRALTTKSVAPSKNIASAAATAIASISSLGRSGVQQLLLWLLRHQAPIGMPYAAATLRQNRHRGTAQFSHVVFCRLIIVGKSGGGRLPFLSHRLLVCG